MRAVTKKETLAVGIERSLRERLASDTYPVGSRLPSEAKLCEEFVVSRPVIREAIATLRAEGRLESRQGSGVFVTAPQKTGFISFQNLDTERVSTVVEMLELRLAIEVESAGLAAVRHSAGQIETIIDASQEVGRLAAQGHPSSEADFFFHVAIAEAANNPRFAEVLRALDIVAIPRRMLQPNRSTPIDTSYVDLIVEEHHEIVSAISNRDQDRARIAMRRHLEGSQNRYRNLILAAQG